MFEQEHTLQLSDKRLSCSQSKASSDGSQVKTKARPFDECAISSNDGWRRDKSDQVSEGKE